MRISHQGKIYDFPDDSSLDEINDFLGVNKSGVDIKNNSDRKNKINALSHELGKDRTPIDTLRDVAGGALRGAQNIAALLGEGGQAIGDLGAYAVTGKWPKDVDIREELGLGKDRPVDLGKLVGSSKPSLETPLLQAVGQYLPGILAGGTTLPGQVASNALYSAVQSQPDEKNLLNKIPLIGENLPTGRPGAMLEGGLAALLPAAIGKIFNGLKSGINYLSPEKTAKNYLSEIGGDMVTPPEKNISFPNEPSYETKLKSQEENINELANRIKFAKESAQKEALIPKDKLFETESKSNIFPSQKKGDDFVYNVAKSIGIKAIDNDQTQELKNALKSYYKENDFDNLQNKIEDIFDIDALSPSRIEKLNNSIEMEPLKNGNYLTQSDVTKGYDEGLKKLHSEFEKNPTLENADNLKIALGREKRRLEGKIASKNYRESDKFKLNRYERLENKLVNDMENYFNTLPSEKQKYYQQFRESWAKNVPKYDKPYKDRVSDNKTISSLSEGSQGIKRNKIINAFQSPNDNVKEILNEIGPEGIKNLKYNKILSANNARDLAESILKSRGYQGYENYFSKDDEEFAKRLLRQILAKNIALGTGGIIGVGSLGALGNNAIKNL